MVFWQKLWLLWSLFAREATVLLWHHYLIYTFLDDRFIRFSTRCHELSSQILDHIQFLLQPVNLFSEALWSKTTTMKLLHEAEWTSDSLFWSLQTSTDSCCCLTTEGSTPGSSSSLSRSCVSLMVTMRAQWSHQNFSAKSMTSRSLASLSSRRAWMSFHRNTIWSSLSWTASNETKEGRCHHVQNNTPSVTLP